MRWPLHAAASSFGFSPCIFNSPSVFSAARVALPPLPRDLSFLCCRAFLCTVFLCCCLPPFLFFSVSGRPMQRLPGSFPILLFSRAVARRLPLSATAGCSIPRVSFPLFVSVACPWATRRWFTGTSPFMCPRVATAARAYLETSVCWFTREALFSLLLWSFVLFPRNMLSGEERTEILERVFSALI